MAEHDPPAAYDDLNVRSIALVGGVGAVLVFVSIVAVQVIYFRYNDAEREQKVIEVAFAQVEEAVAAQRERISESGAGADPEKGEKSIPITDAMDAVIKEYQERQAGGEGRPAEETENAEDAANEEASADAEGAENGNAENGNTDADGSSAEAQPPAAE